MKTFCQIYAQFDQTGDRIAAEWAQLSGLGLICDTTFNFGAQAERNRGVLAELIAAGGLAAPNIYPATLDPSLRDPNWWKYSEEECVRLLRIAQQRFAELDIGPLLAINTYTPGNGLVAACRKLGIRYILGFCAPTVIEDGDWSISHYGSPLSPYFISSEDYRKPESPRDDSVLMSSMEMRNPMVCLNHWSEGPWGPVNAQAADRWLEPSGIPHPFLQVAEDQIRNGAASSSQAFFHLNLQYFFAGRCYDHNHRVLEWLAAQRDQGRLEIGSLQSWAARMKSAGGFVPQCTYMRGEMMGFHVGHRPGSVPDVIVDEDLRRQAVFEYPHALPRRCYDYSRRWDYPAFAPGGEAPSSDAFDDIRVAVSSIRSEGNTRLVCLDITNEGAARSSPIAIWDALNGAVGPFLISVPTGWAARAIAHPAGTGGAIVLEGPIPAGQSRQSISVACSGMGSVLHHKRWGHLIEAQTFEADGKPYTYLAAQTPEPFDVSIHCAASGVRIESLCGIDHQFRDLPVEGMPLHFDATRLTCWHRVWGARANELSIEGVDLVEARLRRDTAALVSRLAPQTPIAEPGYQLFGNIRDVTRWDRTLARAAGERERDNVNAWLKKLRPRAGETVIEVHPGLYLPRGSITKVLGHEFNVIECARGYEFKELCADYPQGWDWGVSAWVQWRHLRVRFGGLRARPQDHVLHLHAFDPESRDISLRVHFFNPDHADVAPLLDLDPGVRSGSELCVVSHWDLPKGLDERWNPAALCSIRIPRECYEWTHIGVWISPLEKMKLYDWVAERGAPGLFSHLWVTRV